MMIPQKRVLGLLPGTWGPLLIVPRNGRRSVREAKPPSSRSIPITSKCSISLGRQFSGDPDLLKDCLQDTFINIRKKRQDLEKVRSVTAYLIKCFRNKIITEQKKNKEKDLLLRSGSYQESLGFLVTPSHERLLVNKQYQQEQIVLIQNSLNKLTFDTDRGLQGGGGNHHLDDAPRTGTHRGPKNQGNPHPSKILE